MISAKEAKETAEDQARVLLTLIETIDKNIRETTRKGGSCLIWDMGIATRYRDALIKHLEANGYTISPRYSNDFYISW